MVIPYTRPSITDLEIAYSNDAVTNGWGRRCYEYIDRFEREFAAHVDVEFAIATSSCTGALHLGLAALGVDSGSEVILADTNWIATLSPVVHLGARPVLVDILPDTWCLDPELVHAAVTDRTRAIIATHLYGNLADIDALRGIGGRHGIPVIEDAAEAIGSQESGRAAGSMGRFGVFSFHGSKTLTTGEGGMLVTNDAALYELALTLSNHGRTRSQSQQFWPEHVGYKFKMSNVQAAIGCAQLQRLDELVARKREILRFYRERLEQPGLVTMNPEPVGTVNGAWMPTLVFDPATGITTEQILTAFRSHEIDARVFFHPLSELPMVDVAANTPVAHSIAARAINLPSFHDITESELDQIVAVVNQVTAAAADAGRRDG